MRRILSALALVFFALVPAVSAQPSTEDLPIYYAVRRQATVFSAPDSGRVYLTLKFREPVYLLKAENGWSHVRTQDGALGYVASQALSNVWIRVSKSEKQLYVYQGAELIKRVPAEFGFNAFADKERRGSLTNPDDWRTPEGIFFVVQKNRNSKFYKALVLNYPTAEDAERGRRQGLISQAEYAAIVRAEQEFTMPPMHTALGGMIEIHGKGTGKGENWTQGCVAVRDAHIDELFTYAEVGTPVLIED